MIKKILHRCHLDDLSRIHDKHTVRHLQIGTDQVTLELMREGKYDQIFKQMETVLDVSKEHRFCGEDGIWVGAE